MKCFKFVTWLFLGVLLAGATTQAMANERTRVTFYEDITVVKGEKYESIVVMLGDIQFHGEVDEMVVLGGSVHLHEGARVNGELVVMGGELIKDAGVYVGGETVEFSSSFDSQEFFDDFKDDSFEGSSWQYWFGVVGSFFIFLASLMLGTGFQIIFFCVVFALGIGLLYAFPKMNLEARSYLLKHLPEAFGWGILFFIAFVPVLFCLVLSFVGLPLVPLMALFYLIVALSGFVVAMVEVGRLIPALQVPGKEGWALLVGAAIFALLGAIPVVGGILVALAFALGSGAVMRVIFSRLGKRRQKVLVKQAQKEGESE